VKGIARSAVTPLDSNVKPYLECDSQCHCEEQHGAQHGQPQVAAERCDVSVPVGVSGGSWSAHKHSYPVETERRGVVVGSTDMRGAGRAMNGQEGCFVDCYCCWWLWWL
jgi:hypothetical protein